MLPSRSLGVPERLLPYLVGACDVGVVAWRAAAYLRDGGVEGAHAEMLPTEGFEAAQAVGRTGFAAQEGQQLLDAAL